VADVRVFGYSVGELNISVRFQLSEVFLENNFISSSTHSGAVKHTCHILRGTVPLSNI